MCNYGGCYGYEPEDITQEDQKAFLEEKEKILEAKLATIRHLRETLDKKSDAGDK